MAMTPITTTARINEQTGLVLAYYGYDQSKTKPEDLKAELGSGWIGADDASNSRPKLIDTLGAGYNLQHAGGNINGTVENSFSVYVNKDTQQIAISFKGSDAISNWISDLANGGASEFAKIQSQAQVALETLQLSYPDFQIIAVGHSLGGGMAQAFALRNGLDAQVYNSLPIANGTISGGYFDSVGGYAAAMANWIVNGHIIQDVRTPNDIATFYYPNAPYGDYLSNLTGQPVTMLPGAVMPDFLKAVLLFSGYGTPFGAKGVSVELISEPS